MPIVFGLPVFAFIAILEPYRLRRITSFLDPWADQLGSGYQLSNALMAVGRGQWTGVGLGASVQKLNYLPEAHTDFIFSVIAEELGFVGVCGVISLYALLVGRAFWLGMRCVEMKRHFSGYGDTLAAKLHHMALPWLTVALSLSAVLTRQLRASLIAETRSDVALAARARGLPERTIFRRHVLPNSILPTLNLLAVNIGWLIGGTVVVEQVFAIPGMGQLLVRAIFSRDYMVVQGVAMVFALATVLVNFLADVLTVTADPRVRL